MTLRKKPRRRRQRHPLAVIFLVVAISITAALIVAFVPVQGTQSRWSSTVSVTAPRLTMDRFNLSSVSDTSSSLPGFVVTNGSTRTTGYWKPQSFTISPWAGSGTTTAEATSYVRNSYGEFFPNAPASCQNTILGQGFYYYPSNNSISSGVPDPVLTPQDRASRHVLAPQAKSHFCTRIVSNLSDYDELRYFAGRAFTLNIASDMTSAAPATWRSTTLNSRMKLSVPFPQPELTACYSDNELYSGSLASVEWAWLSPDTVPQNSAIQRWEFQRRETDGTWSIMDAQAVSNSAVYEFDGFELALNSSAVFRVVAFPYLGRTYYAQGTQTITMSRNLNGYYSCVRANTPTGPGSVMP